MVLSLLKKKKFQVIYYTISDLLVFFRSKIGLLHTFNENDEISRFALKSEHLNNSDLNNPKIHWKCFKPQKIPSKEISVYYTTDLNTEQVRMIGQKYVGDFAKRQILGRAVFSYKCFKNEFKNISCMLSHYPYPHKRHSNILGSFEKSGKLLEYVKLEAISKFDDLKRP